MRFFVHALLLSLAAYSHHAHANWDALQELRAKRGARVTAIAVDLDTGKTLQSLDADVRLTPASLSKVVLAAAALQHWNPDKTFATQVFANGLPQSGTLNGDLVVRSQGDATFDHQALWFLAAQIKRAGVRAVTGDLVIQAAPFGLLACETKDRCVALRRSSSAYDAPLSAFGVDYGTWCVDVLPRHGQPSARVQSCAAVDVPIPLEGQIQTKAPKHKTALWLDRITRPESEALVMGGDMTVDAPSQRLYRSMADPALGAGLLLRQVLGELGIQIKGRVRVSTDLNSHANTLLAQTDSAPLREQIGRLLRYSNNYITDVLTLALAAEHTPGATGSLALASQPLEEFVLDARARSGYPAPASVHDRPVMHSGSGLTPDNRLSALDIAAVLRQQYMDSSTFPVFYAGLVIPGQSEGRRWRVGNGAWKQRVALKTGTLTVPISTFGTAGYLRKKNGGWMAFVALANGQPRKGIASADVLAAIRQDVETLLNRY